MVGVEIERLLIWTVEFYKHGFCLPCFHSHEESRLPKSQAGALSSQHKAPGGQERFYSRRRGTNRDPAFVPGVQVTVTSAETPKLSSHVMICAFDKSTAPLAMNRPVGK